MRKGRKSTIKSKNCIQLYEIMSNYIYTQFKHHSNMTQSSVLIIAHVGLNHSYKKKGDGQRFYIHILQLTLN